jgi:hypothetical protein
VCRRAAGGIAGHVACSLLSAFCHTVLQKIFAACIRKHREAALKGITVDTSCSVLGAARGGFGVCIAVGELADIRDALVDRCAVSERGGKAFGVTVQEFLALGGEGIKAECLGRGAAGREQGEREEQGAHRGLRALVWRFASQGVGDSARLSAEDQAESERASCGWCQGDVLALCHAQRVFMLRPLRKAAGAGDR